MLHIAERISDTSLKSMYPPNYASVVSCERTCLQCTCSPLLYYTFCEDLAHKTATAFSSNSDMNNVSENDRSQFYEQSKFSTAYQEAY